MLTFSSLAQIIPLRRLKGPSALSYQIRRGWVARILSSELPILSLASFVLFSRWCSFSFIESSAKGNDLSQSFWANQTLILFSL